MQMACHELWQIMFWLKRALRDMQIMRHLGYLWQVMGWGHVQSTSWMIELLQVTKICLRAHHICMSYWKSKIACPVRAIYHEIYKILFELIGKETQIIINRPWKGCPQHKKYMSPSVEILSWMLGREFRQGEVILV